MILLICSFFLSQSAITYPQQTTGGLVSGTLLEHFQNISSISAALDDMMVSTRLALVRLSLC